MPTPIKSINRKSIHLYERVDTIIEERDFIFTQDTLLKRRYSVTIDPKWNPGGKYIFSVDSAAIIDVYGLKCDSIGKDFSVKTVDFYGTLLINIESPDDNWLVQLLSSSNEVIQQKYVPKSGKLGFQFIKPGSYDLKLVIDHNMNKQWDTGNYSSKIQPEYVYYYPSKVEVKSNWMIEIPWKVSEFDIYDYVIKNKKPKKKEN